MRNTPPSLLLGKLGGHQRVLMTEMTTKNSEIRTVARAKIEASSFTECNMPAGVL